MISTFLLSRSLFSDTPSKKNRYARLAKCTWELSCLIFPY